MSVIESGTRTWATSQQTVKPSSRHVDRGYTRDLGMTKLVLNQPVVFTATQAVLAGAFGAFGFNDEIIVEGTNLNNGDFTIVAVTAGAITLSPPPNPETPASCTIRVA